MKISFQRITTQDGLELHGLLFEPKIRTTKALVCVHGWVGSFYENKFIDHIAKEAVSKGFAFLTFNNRGAGIINDFIKRKKSKMSYIRTDTIGSYLKKTKPTEFRYRINFYKKELKNLSLKECLTGKGK